jgi:hypothetical protein
MSGIAQLFALALALALAVTGCVESKPRRGLIERAEFGIFFGGQVQERDEIPFSLDRGKQRTGLSIDFFQPLAQPLEVSWELDMPGTTRRGSDPRGRRGMGRIVKTGVALAPAGEKRLEIELPFSAGDPLGTWNVKAVVGGQVVVDRPFLVYDAAARRRAESAHKQREREARSPR